MFGRSSQSSAAAELPITRRQGVLALALVTGLTETGTGIGGAPEVQVRLHVKGPDFAFDTAARLLAGESRRTNLDAGKIVVLVDPATLAIQIDWARSGLVNGLVPARFTLTGDDTTYDLSGQTGPLMEIFQALWASGASLNRAVDAQYDPVLRAQLETIIRRGATERPAQDSTTTAAAPRSEPETETETETAGAGAAEPDSEASPGN